MRVSCRLVKRLNDDLGISLVSIHRIRRGRHGIGSGVWAWGGVTDDGTEIGCEDTMTDCVKAPRLSTYTSLHQARTIFVCAEYRL